MYTAQLQFIEQEWKNIKCDAGFNADNCQLVLVFGSTELIARPEILAYIQTQYPNADIMLSSTAGEITQHGIFDNTVTVTAIEFAKSSVKCAATDFRDYASLDACAAYFFEQLNADDLVAVFIITDGDTLNGSDFMEALNKQNTACVPIVGARAGNGYNFFSALAGLNDVPKEGIIVAAGLYGKDLLVGTGAAGGWDEFGPERTITRSNKNVLFEIDHQKAWDLYKEYLADYVDELTGFALYFPLALRVSENGSTVIRTILGFNETDKSMTFAGNVPEGGKIKLMKANFNNIIGGCATAANLCFQSHQNMLPDLSVLISCIGRKLILQERTEEELDEVKELVGADATITGFYAYGEIAPVAKGNPAELHNQTMCIFTLKEL
jgi:hypothetical protein